MSTDFCKSMSTCEAHANSKVLSAPNHQNIMRVMHTTRSALTNRKGSAYFDLQLQPVSSSRHKLFNTGNAVEFDGIPASSNTSFLNVAKGTLGEVSKDEQYLKSDYGESLTVAFCPCWSQPNPDSTNSTCSRLLVISKGGVFRFTLQATATCLILLQKGVGAACVGFRQTAGWCCCWLIASICQLSAGSIEQRFRGQKYCSWMPRAGSVI